jgi:hypothetical protein
MNLDTPAWRVVFESLKAMPDPDRLRELCAERPDENELYTLCRDHGVLLIVNNALKGILRQLFSSAGLERWRAAVASCTLSGLTMHRELNRLLPLFVDAGISVVPFKGPTLSEKLYGDPALRMFCDLDLLVPHDQVRAMVDLLIEEGYLPIFKPADLRRWLQPKSQHFHCSLQHPSGGWLVEVHWAVFPAWRRALPPAPVVDEWLLLGEGDTVEALLYLCIHGTKHWWWQLKWVVDVDRCVRSAQNLDWDDLFARAEERGCARVVRLALQLAELACGLELPDDVVAEIEQDGSVAVLCQRVTRFWSQPNNVHPPLLWKLRYLLTCRERLSDRIGMILRYPLLRGVR